MKMPMHLLILTALLVVLGCTHKSAQTAQTGQTNDDPIANPTEGQKLLKADSDRWGSDIKAIQHGLVPNDKAAKMILETDNNLIMQDAQILGGEVTHFKIVAFNPQHPEHQYADVEDTIAMLIKVHNNFQSLDHDFRVKVNWPVQ
jgi:hypothetical protein